MNIFFQIIKDFFISFGAMWQAFSYIWFIALPVAFYYLFKFLWMDHIIKYFLEGIDWVLLELIPPRDIEKSPKIMESIYAGLAGVWKSIFANEQFMEGLVQMRFSLELVSEEGKVHFYIRTARSFRNLVEATIYAQYPDVQIIEVSDYTQRVPKLIPNKTWNLWGSDMELAKEDMYPIKTYKYFQEDVTGKMIDPLSAVVEWMGKVPPAQHAWIQIIIEPDAEAWNITGRGPIEEFLGRKKKNKGLIANVISDFVDVFRNIFSGMLGPVEFAKEEEKEQQPLEFRLSPGEKEVLKALEENAGKNFFKTKMRFIYLGKKENFDKANMVSSFFGSMKQFADQNLNSLKPNERSKTQSLYIATESRMKYRQRKILHRYRERDMTGIKFHLSTMELATIFHFPDMSVVAPSVTRIEAKRGGAPANLPIQ